MFHSDDRRPPGIRTPDRETAEEFGEPVAVLRDAPAGWLTLLGRQSSDGFLHCLDVGYHRGTDLMATVQTSRPLPESHRVRPFSTPESELWVFLANSGRISHGTFPEDLGPVRHEVVLRLDGLATRVAGYRSHGCTSASLPCGAGHLVVTAPDAHWEAVADLVLRRAGDFQGRPRP
ncbi:hypothetical protein [Kitasatospora sp. NPDC005748]|uniref:hypothetical protein n=1 Tax=Kitasatospora sp. NPDC005748 TaxID=3157063 RepID=UPI0033F79F03